MYKFTIRPEDPVFRKCHVLSTLKTPCNNSFWVVRRRPVTRLNFPPLSNPQFFQWQSKSPSLTGPFLSVYILIYCLLTCFRPEYAWNICHWTLNHNQSINQSLSAGMTFKSAAPIKIMFLLQTSVYGTGRLGLKTSVATWFCCDGVSRWINRTITLQWSTSTGLLISLMS